MNRHTTKNDIIKLLKKLRKHIPGLALRTSVIVGFPGETDHDFKELLDFVSETKFERLGAFIYSKEDGTEASGFKPEVLEKVKKERFDELMKLQQRIASKVNESFLNKTMLVLIDEKVQTEENEYLGRTEYDAPEADGKREARVFRRLRHQPPSKFSTSSSGRWMQVKMGVSRRV